MEREELIINDLVGKFGFLNEKCSVSRTRRIFAEVPAENIIDIIKYSDESLNFNALLTITGLDSGDDFEVIYHLSEDKGIILNLKIKVPKSNPVIKTVTDIFQGSALYERELKDMFGIITEGLPEGRRYPLPEGWPEDQHPLRKDWNPDDMKGVLNYE